MSSLWKRHVCFFYLSYHTWVTFPVSTILPPTRMSRVFLQFVVSHVWHVQFPLFSHLCHVCFFYLPYHIWVTSPVSTILPPLSTWMWWCLSLVTSGNRDIQTLFTTFDTVFKTVFAEPFFVLHILVCLRTTLVVKSLHYWEIKCF